MSTKKRRNTNKTVGVGMTAKQMRRKRPINNGMLVDVEPITDNQKVLFDHYAKERIYLHMVLLELVRLL